jgi:riboflavin kinase/FMN adenylyltransferase
MKTTVLALGYFDAIHKGHQLLLNEAQKLADSMDSEVLVCTFGDNFYELLGEKSKDIFLLAERKKILENFGFNNICIFDTTKEFLKKSKEDFMQYLLQFNPKGIVVGADYTFGQNASGNAEILKSYFEKKNIKTQIIDILLTEKEKISSTLIKQYLSEGNIKKVNELLNFEYFCKGEIVFGRQVGTSLGIPTANINISSKKYPPKSGVYVSKILIRGKLYSSITNIGEHPTFSDDKFNIETHIFDFNENIYNEEAIVYFKKYLREIVKFSTKEQLIKQINIDIKIAKEVNND